MKLDIPIKNSYLVFVVCLQKKDLFCGLLSFLPLFLQGNSWVLLEKKFKSS